MNGWQKNHLTTVEVWLVYYKKPSGKPRIPYSDAVEEALCFGWIDGKIKKSQAMNIIFSGSHHGEQAAGGQNIIWRGYRSLSVKDV